MRTYHPKADRLDPMMRVLNLGAGVQSTTVLLLALNGEIPPLDAAIFADTGWEPQAVYEHLDKLTALAEENAVPLYVVSNGNIREDALNPDKRFASMPAYVKNPDGTQGMGRRQCTKEYKITPIRNRIRELVAEELGIDAPTWRQIPNDVRIDQAFGISVDEVRRARTPRDRWAVNYYPLLELGWTRNDCRQYLDELGIDAPRSACIGCPYHNDDEWRHLRDNDPDAWADAVAFDEAFRNGGIRSGKAEMMGQQYLHRQMLPLADVDLTTPEEHGQLSLAGSWDAECEGLCGI